MSSACQTGFAPFPDPRNAAPDGLVAVGGELSVPYLHAAYRGGMFPWSARPVTWWSPDPRAIIELDDLRVPRSLVRIMKKRPFLVTRDAAFRRVMQECARPVAGRRKTWIAKSFIEAYTAFHEAGFAHSVECWLGDELVGGAYGVAIGGYFAGESMFHRVDNASKIAVVELAEHLKRRGYALFDVQMVTPVTAAMGAIEIPRETFLARLELALRLPCTFRD